MTEHRNNSYARRRPIHGVLPLDRQPTIIFDTACTKGRKGWLACNAVHTILREVWQQADLWKVGRYVVMPDHVHFFAGATHDSPEYEAWSRYWKSQFSKRLQRRECRWQTDHWDTRVRSFEAYEEKWLYVLNNPVRRGLVTQVADWPYQGTIHELRWD